MSTRASAATRLLRLALIIIPGGGCADPPITAAPASALRPVPDAAARLDLEAAFRERSDALLAALDRSAAWFDRPESRARFPTTAPSLTHARARAGVVAFRELLHRCSSGREFVEELTRRFDVYESIGDDGHGTVLFTAYYAPEHPASLERTGRFRYPLYRVPPALAPDNPRNVVWFTRARIEEGRLLAGLELAWLEDPLSVYLIHVNGSARLRLPGGGVLCVGHCATNERPYTSLGRLMVAEGLADAGEMSMRTIRNVFRRDPDTVQRLMRMNDRFVFFREHPPDAWPEGGLGIPLTAGVSLATDKSLFPAGGVVLVDTTIPTLAGEGPPARFHRFMLDQDRGGAIRSPGRADMYLGVGERVGAIAGAQKAAGRLYYFVLKPGR